MRAMSIEATDRLSDFNFGLSLWNGIVDKIVPGQLIGGRHQTGDEG